MSGSDQERPWGLRESYLFDRNVIAEIQRAAREGIYDIRGFGAKRRLPHFDDLLFLGASISRYPLEGYREKCATDVVLGTRFAKKPLELKIPVTIAGMSFGALSAPAKEALGRGATEVGTSTTTGDGGMTNEERAHSKTLVYQLLPSRYGMNPDDLRRADAIEVVIGQGAKPGGGGMLLGHKISDRVAEMRSLPKGIDQRSASRHPDWTGPDDLEIKIQELREITDWEKPIFVKVGATRTFYDVQLAVKAGADVIVVDGMQGGTAATQDVFIEHVGIPTLPAVRLAVDALQELGVHREVQLIVSGGIRSGADKAMKKAKNDIMKIPFLAMNAFLKLIAFLLYDLNLDLRAIGFPKDAFGGATVTNVGSLGLDVAYVPLVPYTRVPIFVAPGLVRDEAVVDGGKVVPGRVMYINASSDHRFIDGYHAMVLSRTLREVLADPWTHLDPLSRT
jgi:hypothetical protein